mmetsp:Transcript_49371/g.107514  ORF Transcript_49371/g.107514 Transcript_49371/m.107514 type:complete len:287 (+) Transcript_49371:45-905(+)
MGVNLKMSNPRFAGAMVQPRLQASCISERAADQQRCTVMLGNIPNKYTQNVLLLELERMGFADSYDFFYLPVDVRNRRCVGYAFINFVSPTEMLRFKHVFGDYRFRLYPTRSKKALVCTARIQGLEANILHFFERASGWSRNSFSKPVVKIGGEFQDVWDVLSGQRGQQPGQRGELPGQLTQSSSSQSVQRAFPASFPQWSLQPGGKSSRGFQKDPDLYGLNRQCDKELEWPKQVPEYRAAYEEGNQRKEDWEMNNVIELDSLVEIQEKLMAWEAALQSFESYWSI